MEQAKTINRLPNLKTENHGIEWIAYLEDIKGMIASGTNENEAIENLMVSIKVMLLYNRDNK